MFRPMQRVRQQLSHEECVSVLEAQTRGVLSVLGDDGYPYGVPLNYWYDFESGSLCFHSGKTGHKLDAIGACDKVSFCVTEQGARQEGEWWYRVRSVIVFGRIRMVEERDEKAAICRKLSLKFTDDEAYISDEITRLLNATCCFRLIPEHISGKTVTEK